MICNREFRHTPCFKTRLNLFDNEGKTEDFDEMEYIGFYELDVDENGKFLMIGLFSNSIY
ncbi:MAG: hypothetical protein GQ574_20810 [Crocinitomix sp.]|nr:hypothetical protein [Crocinitomix sp.]